MTNPTHDDEVTTVNLASSPPTPEEHDPGEPSTAGAAPAEDTQQDWVGDGLELYLETDPENPHIVELHTLTRIGEETGLVITGLNPVALRALHTQIGSVIEDQRYVEWLASGHHPDDFEEATDGDTEETNDHDNEDEDDDEKRSRFQRATDPAGLSRMVEKLGGDSPVKGLDWGTLTLLAFLIAAVLLVLVSKLT